MKTERVNDLISRVAQGEISLVHEVLESLAHEYLLLPVSAKFNTGDARGTQRVTVPTLQLDARTVVPVFTSEDAFSSWSDGHHNCLSLIGADVVDSVPRGAGMIINPGQPFSLELSPAELEAIVRVANGESLGSLPVASRATTANGGGQARNSKNGIDRISEQLVPQLHEVFRDFPAVLEAFVVPVKTPTSEVVLGLLTEGLKADLRFDLLSRIAEISRAVFGNVGAVEVFDDLHSRVSTSWELFQAQAPFYSRSSSRSELQQPAEQPTGPLAGQPLAGQQLVGQIEKHDHQPTKATAKGKKLFLVSRLFGNGARNSL